MKFRSALTLGAIALLLTACTGTPSGVEPVTGFDAERYQGRWYEIFRLDHRFERGLTNVTADYRILDDGRVEVINRGFDPRKCEWRDVEGTARFLEDPGTASLAVSFFFGISGGYHVIALDHEDYGYSMVSGPTRGYLWILAREPRLDADIVERLIEQAAALDFPTEELIRVDHGEQDC
ncbi:MAG: lipocalin family protein [Gammaproteobacteria bacterium]|nr:lipocalin family protein [Gammaproteobacteria bacterium]